LPKNNCQQGAREPGDIISYRWATSSRNQRATSSESADEALRRGYREIRLYTHETMVENQRLYAAIGYEETGRGSEAGYNRVFMRKQLRD
jgi:hypothetical protein